jgi:hypothetical protein
MARAPSPKCAGGFGAVSAAYDAPAQSRGQRALRVMAASARAVSLPRRVSSSRQGPRRFRRSVLFRLPLDRHDGLCNGTLAHAPHCRKHRLGRGAASHARAVGGRRALACLILARRRDRPRCGLGVRRKLTRHILAWPEVAQPQPLARSGLVVRSLPARRPDSEPRRLAHRHNRRADQGFRRTKAGRRAASSGKAGAKSRPAALASGGVRPPAHRA